jgi:hypothetical protein
LRCLLTPTPGELTFEITRRLVQDAIAVSDGEVRAAIGFAFRELKLVLEPGGAVALAALLAGKIDIKREECRACPVGRQCRSEKLRRHDRRLSRVQPNSAIRWENVSDSIVRFSSPFGRPASVFNSSRSSCGTGSGFGAGCACFSADEHPDHFDQAARRSATPRCVRVARRYRARTRTPPDPRGRTRRDCAGRGFPGFATRAR